MVKKTLSIEEISYLKKYEPIGCRDEITLQTIRKYGIISYLHGCITTTLSKREDKFVNNRVYIVDVDEYFLDAIPEGIKKAAQYRTHFVQVKRMRRIEMLIKTEFDVQKLN